CAPVGPAAPAAPVPPFTPPGPCAPGAPGAPGPPADPATPVAPGVPLPFAPEAPLGACGPGGPGGPSGPGEPAGPGRPAAAAVTGGADGTTTATGAGAAWACTSVRAVIAPPASETPPFATPAWTDRVSLTELTTVPVGAISAAFSVNVFDGLDGSTMVLNRPESVAAIDTMTRPPTCWTDEPGMNRIASPSRAPAVRPDASTVNALVV